MTGEAMIDEAKIAEAANGSAVESEAVHLSEATAETETAGHPAEVRRRTGGAGADLLSAESSMR